jgi:hypothetical protein
MHQAAIVNGPGMNKNNFTLLVIGGKNSIQN